MSRASAGVIEVWPKIFQTDLPKTLHSLKTSGSFKIFGAYVPTANAQNSISQLGFPHTGQILVMGSEHVGVSKHVLGLCDGLVSLQKGARLGGDIDGIDSLNVSAAAAILISHMCEMHRS